MSEPRIVKFGTIFENEEGELNIHDFHIDADNGPMGPKRILELIAERIEQEIEKLNTPRPKLILPKENQDEHGRNYSRE